MSHDLQPEPLVSIDPEEPLVFVGDTSWRRYVALAADNLLALGLSVGIGKMIAPAEGALTFAILAMIYLLYFFLTEGIWERTPGKAITGLIVVQDDGTKASWGAVAVRTVFRLFDANPILLGALPGAVAIFSSRQRKRIGDMAARTVVIRNDPDAVRFTVDPTYELARRAEAERSIPDDASEAIYERSMRRGELPAEFAYDREDRLWTIRGSREALAMLAEILRDDTQKRYLFGPGESLHLGLNDDFRIKYASKPAIDRKGIEGLPSDIQRLGDLIEAELLRQIPGKYFDLGGRYAPESADSLRFVLMEDSFAPETGWTGNPEEEQ